jgi:hypothetical protein
LFEAIDHVGKHVKPLAYEAVLILTDRGPLVPYQSPSS